MANLTVKNIPTQLYERLKDAARKHRRSVNSQAIVCLEQSLGSKRVDVETLLVRVRAIHKELSFPPLTDDFLEKAKTTGRP